jgi:hypothetical protein
MNRAGIHTPDDWRQRAEDARTRADELRDPYAKRMMILIAKTYSAIAARAEIRELEARAASSKRSTD